MCIVFFNLNHSQNSKYKLILAANRDEYLSRPAATTSYWTHHNQSNILAPEDLKCKAGTWFGMTTDGRLATLTNYRQAEGMETPDKRSRGVLPVQFLRNQSNSMETFIHGLLPHENEYNGFSLLLANMSQLQIGFVNNIRHQSVSDISEGLHALTNGTLDEPWPKIIRGKNLMKETMEQFESFLSSSSSSSSSIKLQDEFVESLFNVLYDDQRVHNNDDLPQTGNSIEWERNLSSIFVDYPEVNYGTRSSAVVLVDHRDNVYFEERCLASNALKPDGSPDKEGDILIRNDKEWLRKRFTFSIK